MYWLVYYKKEIISIRDEKTEAETCQLAHIACEQQRQDSNLRRRTPAPILSHGPAPFLVRSRGLRWRWGGGERNSDSCEERKKALFLTLGRYVSGQVVRSKWIVTEREKSRSWPGEHTKAQLCPALPQLTVRGKTVFCFWIRKRIESCPE